MDKQSIQRSRETVARQFVATMRFHYRMADAYAREGRLSDAAKALQAADGCREQARKLGAAV